MTPWKKTSWSTPSINRVNVCLPLPHQYGLPLSHQHAVDIYHIPLVTVDIYHFFDGALFNRSPEKRCWTRHECVNSYVGKLFFSPAVAGHGVLSRVIVLSRKKEDATCSRPWTISLLFRCVTISGCGVASLCAASFSL